MIRRRGFLAGLGVALAAPAIIRTPGLLMPVKPVRPVMVMTLDDYAQRILNPLVDKWFHEQVKIFEDALIYGVGASRVGADGLLEHVPYDTLMVRATDISLADVERDFG